MKKKIWFLSACFTCISMLIYTGCGKKSSTSAPPPPEVTCSKPLVHDVTNYAYYTGHTEASRSVDLVARVSGYLQEARYSSGGKVGAGQVLFVIEPHLYQDAVDQAKAQIEGSLSQLSLAEATLQKVKQAAQSNAVSEIDLLQAEARKAEAEASLKVARAQLSSAEQNLSYTHITAPHEGRITRNYIDVGNLVGPSSANVKLATLVDDDPIWIYFTIEDTWVLSAVKALQKKEAASDILLAEDIGFAYVSLVDGDGYPYKSRINYTDPFIDLSSGTVTFRGELSNPDGLIPPGMFVKVKMPTTRMPGAMLVPDHAVSADQAGNYLWVIDDSNVVHRVNVRTGDLYHNEYRIVAGDLHKDSRIVTKGLQRIQDGIKVSAMEEKLDDPFIPTSSDK